MAANPMPGLKANTNWYTKTIYLYEQQDGKCYYCRNPLWSEDVKDVTMDIDIDHKIPTSRGGKNQLDNYCLSCRPCNSQKSDLTEGEYLTALKAIADGKIQKKDLNEYGKYTTSEQKFRNVHSNLLADTYDRGWQDRNNEIIELAESMKTILDPDEEEFYSFDEGRNIALGALIKSITPKQI